MTTIQSKPGRHYFTQQGRRIIEHVARYRLTTVEVLCHTVLPALSPSAAAKRLNRLCESGYLRKFTLLHPVRYFVLAETSRNLLGPGLRPTAPLGPQSLPTEYAVLAYATLGKQVRLRLTMAEVNERCPWLAPSQAKVPHCEETPQGILELVRVDLGGPADHVARKCAADIHARERLHEFSSLLKQGRFRLVVITATKEKAAAVRQALDRHDWPTGLQIHFSIIPQLISLTTK